MPWEILKLWRWFLFQNNKKFDVDFGNAIKFVENVDGFEDNCVWTVGANFC